MVMNPCDTMTNQATSSTVSSTDSTYPYSRFLVQLPHKRATWYEKLTTGPESAVGDVHKCHASDVISRLGALDVHLARSKVGATRCPLIYVPCP